MPSNLTGVSARRLRATADSDTDRPLSRVDRGERCPAWRSRGGGWIADPSAIGHARRVCRTLRGRGQGQFTSRRQTALADQGFRGAGRNRTRWGRSRGRRRHEEHYDPRLNGTTIARKRLRSPPPTGSRPAARPTPTGISQHGPAPDRSRAAGPARAPPEGNFRLANSTSDVRLGLPTGSNPGDGAITESAPERSNSYQSKQPAMEEPDRIYEEQIGSQRRSTQVGPRLGSGTHGAPDTPRPSPVSMPGKMRPGPRWLALGSTI